MKKGIVSIRGKGFTLIEVLVTVVVIGVLAAVVIPAVTAQVTAGDSSRVISDLNNLRTGIESFDIAVRQFPGDVDDLVNQPGTEATSTSDQADADVLGQLYVGPTSWKGPYIETSLPLSVTSSTDPNPNLTAYSTGYTATINNKLWACNSKTATSACDNDIPNADYVAVELDGLTAAQAATLNTSIDGSSETVASTTGKFRFVSDAASSTGYYYATPIK